MEGVMNDEIDFGELSKTVEKSLSAGGRDKAKRTTGLLLKLLETCGEASRSRRMALRISRLLVEDEITIVAPCCPDYTHHNGKYTFQGLNGGISLLAGKHISFLKEITETIPRARVILLYADQEAEDEEMLRVTRKSKTEFAALVDNSVSRTLEEVSRFGWKADLMTRFFPAIIQEETAISLWIRNNPDLERRITAESIQREEMYCRISRRLTSEEKIGRTVRTAAQYIALGRHSVANKYLICNHTTTNLSWYLESGAAILHNPVSIY